jgi:hypothetical protein
LRKSVSITEVETILGSRRICDGGPVVGVVAVMVKVVEDEEMLTTLKKLLRLCATSHSYPGLDRGQVGSWSNAAAAQVWRGCPDFFNGPV